MALLNASTLLLTIPLIVVTLPSLPLPTALRRRNELPVSKGVLFLVVVVLAMVPVEWARVLSDVVMVEDDNCSPDEVEGPCCAF